MARNHRHRTREDINGIQCPTISSSLDIIQPNRIQTFRSSRSHQIQCVRRLSYSPTLPAQHNDVLSTQAALGCVTVIFISSILLIGYVYSVFPKLDQNEVRYMKIPVDIEGAKKLGIVLDKYKDSHFYQVLFGIIITYIFLQSFAIPGSLFLSILSGFLFPFSLAITLVCACSAIGASLCFLISHLAGKRLVWRFFPHKAREWAITVERNKDNLLFYMIFLRVTPLLPNWFINLTAPIIGVPLVPFALGTFLGVAPPSFVAIQAGKTLHSLTSSTDAFSWTSIVILFVFAIISLLPVILKNKLKKKFE